MTQKTMFIFPGQGSQFVGMGADLANAFPEAKEVFQEVDDALHQKLSDLMFAGNIDELTQTQNAQPAIMAVSMAVWRVLATKGIKADAVAGHSLGEYSALCAAGVLSLSETAKLLQARGMAMAKACDENQGGMLALLGSTPEQASEIAKKSGCYVANDNAPGQIVLSGALPALENAKKMATQMDIKRAIPLKVAGAFHSPLMQSAANEMTPILKAINLNAPKFPVYFNVTANEEEDPHRYADLLIQQITAPVRWRELILNSEATRFVECGPGTVLAGLVKRTLNAPEVYSVSSVDSIQTFFK